jgi:hypothetical protein
VFVKIKVVEEGGGVEVFCRFGGRRAKITSYSKCLDSYFAVTKYAVVI